MEAKTQASYKSIFQDSIALKDNEQLILEERVGQESLLSPVNQMKEPLDGFGEPCLVSQQFKLSGKSVAFDPFPSPKRTFKSDIPLDVLQDSKLGENCPESRESTGASTDKDGVPSSSVDQLTPHNLAELDFNNLGFPN